MQKFAISFREMVYISSFSSENDPHATKRPRRDAGTGFTQQPWPVTSTTTVRPVTCRKDRRLLRHAARPNEILSERFCPYKDSTVGPIARRETGRTSDFPKLRLYARLGGRSQCNRGNRTRKITTQIGSERSKGDTLRIQS
jgi:hypothetical protein